MAERERARNRLLRLSVGVLLMVACAVQAVGAGGEADARILIDISGSMKQNDPHNLRRPALRMLVGLLPEDARAGVWTFGQYVNMLIPLGQVDGAWRERARGEAGSIGSPGQFTNIEAVIRRSIADWEGPATRYQRHLILLTDGMVDISKNPGKNAASRRRILEQLLPRLKAHDARVHTIALSERADHELMRTLSRESGGWYEQVNDAQQLQRVFLRIFEKVGRPDTLPLKDNSFLVDSSIQEVTLLVFRQESAAPTRVITPSGETFDAKSAPQGVNWHRDLGYDLLTIARPESGEWRIQAAMDPDNRVIVVTDLKMHSNQLPNRFVLGERLPLAVSFTNQGERIVRKDFLDLVTLEGRYTDSKGTGEARPIFDQGQAGDAVAGDGEFTLLVGEGLDTGMVELLIRAEGKTFQREQRQTFELVDPLAMRLDPVDQDGVRLQLQLRVDGDLVDPETLELEASLLSPAGEAHPVELLPGTEAGVLEAGINTGALSGEWTLSLSARGETRSGNELDLLLDPLQVRGTAPPPAPAEKVVESPPAAEPAVEPKPQAPPPMAAPGAREDGFSQEVMLFGVANLLLALLVALAAWVMRRRKKAAQFQLEEAAQVASGESAQ